MTIGFYGIGGHVAIKRAIDYNRIEWVKCFSFHILDLISLECASAETWKL